MQARNIVRRERVEYTCSPINREFDISDTQGCDGEGVRTYRLVVQLLPIVLGPTWRPSTLPVQTQISTTRVSSRKSSDGHKHRLYSPWFYVLLLVVLSSDGADIFRRRKIRAVFLFRLLVIMLSSGVTGAMRTGKALTNR